MVACPGLIDLHAHLREPGYEYKETIATGALAASRGGFTTICCMPNTDPPIDSGPLIEFVLRRAREAGLELADLEELAAAGAVAFSDDGDPVQDANLMRMALTYGADLGKPVSNHCEDLLLSADGVMAEGAIATRLGLAGIPPAAEDAMIARDIALAASTGGRLHVAHVSTAGSVPLVRRAKELGLNVTAEVCPHHLTITDEWALGTKGNGAGSSEQAYDTSTKVYPPLRNRSDVEALVEALADGTIDCIATDHAPHDVATKQVTYEDAAFGISVLETALGSSMQLFHLGRISLPVLVERLTAGPARVLGAEYIPLASLAPGTPADVLLFDPDQEWTVNAGDFASKGKNTPLDGTNLRGRVVATIAAGKIIHQSGQLRLQEADESA
ncbi:Dihydroorotase [Geodia barretti]|uniref:Dihydroorotase n=1 Tax=Geodia barretti TaxID=519541 RepID=A0AA35XDM5_GEOBA|nr:Dihydroorotase [Geodia barretti]